MQQLILEISDIASEVPENPQNITHQPINHRREQPGVFRAPEIYLGNAQDKAIYGRVRYEFETSMDGREERGDYYNPPEHQNLTVKLTSAAIESAWDEDGVDVSKSWLSELTQEFRQAVVAYWRENQERIAYYETEKLA